MKQLLPAFFACFSLIFFLDYQSVAQRRKLVWSDEFDKKGLPDSTRWNYDVGGDGWGNNELQYYTSNRSENARVDSGLLVIEARKEDMEGNKYTSARLVSKGKGDWTYGR
ncbi:MAG TPA: glycoside hydrolase family 16 protein, partial [Flavitalea sp.]|nr:glycoside hydrolase family 16 protein [Flavitalea sp.]